jgi:hypothetical protein
MNLYSINTIKQNLSFSPIVYSIRENDYSESIYLNYRDTENNELQEVLTAGNAILSNLMEILDYDVEEKDILEGTFNLLLTSVNYLSISGDYTTNQIADFIDKINNNNLVDLVSSVLDILKECFDKHPILVYLYPSYYTLLNTLYRYTIKTISLDDAATLYSNCIINLISELTSLSDTYHSARSYAQSVFIEPYVDNASIPCTTSSALYHSYCKISNNVDFYSDTYGYPTDISYINNQFSGIIPTWSSYLQTYTKPIIELDFKTFVITSFAQFIHIGFSLMLSNGMIIRKCGLCNGYFLVKYSSEQMYCNRIYKNTSATCSEVGVRKTYKEKLFQHPIHQEFTKAYNKLYGRIRRGKVPSDTPIMDDLKRLHDEYTEKYENTHTKDREAVWKEYIQKNKELLG